MLNILPSETDKIVLNALQEDSGSGDITTALLIPPQAKAAGEIIFKEDGILAGLFIAKRVFELLNYDGNFEAFAEDGELIRVGERVALVKGNAASLLRGERIALNFLQHLSGIATLTYKAIKALKGSRIEILDTRKTLPGLRQLEKYAVRMGGGKNHRIGLFDGILIKDNHLKFYTDIKAAVQQAQSYAPIQLKVEVEVRTLDEIAGALEAGADIIMLDNMTFAEIKKALEVIAGRAKVEVSGKVDLEKLAELAQLKIDYISMGLLTHSAPALDISMKIKPLL
jgi:nicotinate-nucleotide pyrophosphorylase (carboxylating)